MRIAKLSATLIGVVIVVQAATWAAVGSRRSTSLAVDAQGYYFELAQRRAARDGWTVDGRLPAATFVVSEAGAELLGSETFDALTKQAQAYNVELRIGVAQDEWVVEQTHNNPLFATVLVGHVGSSCAVIGPVDYLNVVGWWVRVPPHVSNWVRDTIEDVVGVTEGW